MIAIVFASTIGVGVLLGITITTIVFVARNRRKAQANATFEAAMQDSGLGLDEAFEQVHAGLCTCVKGQVSFFSLMRTQHLKRKQQT